MSILSAIKQQSGSIEDLAKLPQTMIMQMAQRKEIVPEMVPAILAKKADMIDRAAKAKAAQGGVPQQSVMDQIMAKNAESENPQAMGQMPPPMPQQNQMAQQPQQPQGPADVGIASNPVPPMQLAGGGIIAFAAGDQVKGNKQQPIATDYQADIRAALDAQKNFNPTEKSDLMAQQFAQEMKDRKGQSMNMALANMAAGMAAGDSPYFFTNVGRGAQKGVESLAASNAQEQADRKMLLQNQVEGERFKEQRRVAGLGNLIQAQAGVDAKKIAQLSAEAQKASALAGRQETIRAQYDIARQTAITNRAKDLMSTGIKQHKYNEDPRQAIIDATYDVDSVAPQRMLDAIGIERPPVRQKDIKPPEPEKSSGFFNFLKPATPGGEYVYKNGKLVPVDK